MFRRTTVVDPSFRALTDELDVELHARYGAILETGFLQPEAIALYERLGYVRSEPFGPYLGMDASISVCMRKSLAPGP